MLASKELMFPSSRCGSDRKERWRSTSTKRSFLGEKMSLGLTRKSIKCPDTLFGCAMRIGEPIVAKTGETEGLSEVL
jgi:hypothetical protein